MTAVRTMLSFDTVGGTFQTRAAAIIRRNGYLLIHRLIIDDFWTLPGGRVEFGEDAATTIRREIAEELQCGAVVGDLTYVVENLFEIERRAVHEIGFYFETELDHSFPFSEEEVCYRMEDGGAQFEFRWVRPDAATLAGYDFKPVPLIPVLGSPATALRHLVQAR
jgi:ADP-ribose pyrophosphatase YjhB (NUDIX family)